MRAQCRKAVREESPGSIEQGCRVIPGGGDSKDSATEKKRLKIQVSVERCGKSAPGNWRLLPRVNPIRSNTVGIVKSARHFSVKVARVL